MLFEISKTDLAARIGTLHTNHGDVKTPAYVPVIHPVRQSILAEDIRKMGFELVITNAYITRKNYGDKAIKQSIHDIIKFDGSVMTDSGGYQVLEYGDLDVTPPEMARFEMGINSDIAIPLDKPTGFGMTLQNAQEYVNHTLKVSRQTLKDSDHTNGQIWVGPIQGGEHLELVTKSTKSLVRMGYKMLALGSPVEFMESYEYRLLAQMISAAKQSIPHSIPLHLFGAGHPLTIPFAVALGCDTFDSASYILYAKQQRYIFADGTRRLNEIVEFPCACPVCAKYTPQEVCQLDPDQRTSVLAMHNLYAIKLEVDSTRQAIHEGRLWEYIIKKARAHPRLFETIEVMTNSCDSFGIGTPKFKEKALFLYGKEDQYRPEISAYRKTVRRFKTKKRIVLIIPEYKTKPGYLAPQYIATYKRLADKQSTVQVCQYDPVIGLIPIELSDMFPAAHHETARIGFNPEEFVEFGDTLQTFFENNRIKEVRYDQTDSFLTYFVDRLPSKINRVVLEK